MFEAFGLQVPREFCTGGKKRRVALGNMTSHPCQDARDKAGGGLLSGKNREFGEGYGATSQRHVRFDSVDAEVKVKDEDGGIEIVDCNVLLGWDELCKSPRRSLGRTKENANEAIVVPWQQDNEFILTSHRRATNSYLHSLQSVFRVHNETVNIWSHIVGAAIFLSAAILLYVGRKRNGQLDDVYNTNADDVAVGIYFISVIACFFFSFM